MEIYTVLRGMMGDDAVDDVVFMIAVWLDSRVYKLFRKDGVGIEGRSDKGYIVLLCHLC